VDRGRKRPVADIPWSVRYGVFMRTEVILGLKGNPGDVVAGGEDLAADLARVGVAFETLSADAASAETSGLVR